MKGGRRGEGEREGGKKVWALETLQLPAHGADTSHNHPQCRGAVDHSHQQTQQQDGKAFKALGGPLVRKVIKR